jgi:hypothetical protein
MDTSTTTPVTNGNLETTCVQEQSLPSPISPLSIPMTSPDLNTQAEMEIHTQLNSATHLPNLHLQHHEINNGHSNDYWNHHFRHHNNRNNHSSMQTRYGNQSTTPRTREVLHRQHLRQTNPPIRGESELDLFSGMRALGAIGNGSDQFLNPIREPRWAHEQRLLNLMDENTALAMFTAYSDEDAWINGEKSVCGSMLPKYYYQQEIERTVHGWIEEERKHLEHISRASSISSRSPRSSSSTTSITTEPLCALSFSRGPSAPYPHLDTSAIVEPARLRRSSISSVRSSYLPDLSPVGSSSRAVSVPTSTRSIQDGR